MPVDLWVQRAINSFEEGPGSALIKGFAVFCLAAGIYAVHAYTHFRGFTEPEAMEHAQLARNLYRGNGFTTQCVRPSELRLLNSKPGYDILRHPDLRHGPVFPFILSAGMRVAGPDFSVQLNGDTYTPETRAILPACILLSMGAGLFIYLLGTRLYGPATGGLAAVSYFLMDSMLELSTRGTCEPALMFFVTGGIYALMLAISQREKERPAWTWLVSSAVAGALCGLAFLTGYTAGIIALVSCAVLFLSMRSGGPAAAALFAAVFMAVVAPWLARNQRLVSNPLGMAPQAALNYTHAYPADSRDRAADYTAPRAQVVQALRIKLTRRMTRIYNIELRTLGEGLVICFFFAGLFYSDGQRESNALKWLAAVGAALLLPLAALLEPGGEDLMNMLLPVIVLAGVAFFVRVLEMHEFPDPSLQALLRWVFVGLIALPTAVGILSPQPRYPYPPYYPPFIAYATGLLAKDEAVCTDIPWAVAWYGDRTAILLPKSVDRFSELKGELFECSAVYLTTRSAELAGGQGMEASPLASWSALLKAKVPADFAFKQGIRFPPDSTDQVFLTSRELWSPPPPSKRAENQPGIGIRPAR